MACSLITGSAFGTQENKKFTFSKSVNFHAGVNSIELLSVNMGLPVCFLILFLTRWIKDSIWASSFITPTQFVSFPYQEHRPPFWNMEHRSPRTCFLARARTWYTRLVMAKMVIQGSWFCVCYYLFPSSTKNIGWETYPFYFSLGWNERRSHGLIFTK